MILVLTGYHSMPFNRLVMWMDKYASNGEEAVIIQRGVSKVETRFAKAFSFVPEEEMLDLYSEAHVVVSHAGVGTILQARRRNIPLILVPRKKELKEHVDDHQMEIASVLRGSEGTWVVDTIDALFLALSQATTSSGFKAGLSPNRDRLLAGLAGILKQVELALSQGGHQ